MSITISDLEAACANLRKLKDEKEEIEAILKEKSQEVRDVQTQINAMLEHEEMSSFKSKSGTVVRTERWSVRTPKDPDSKALFFNYLKEKGLYEQMRTVNSQTLNAYFNQERKAAIEEGREPGELPGIEPATVSYTIALRKG